jgi:formamidopyrimidine-DNA glycosylase
MPELPEVETIRRTLQPRLAGLKFTGAHIYLPKVIAAPAPEKFKALLTGKKITGLQRRGKYLLFDLTGGYTLIVHLRMTGSMVYRATAGPLSKHVHVAFYLDNGSRLYFADLRQFGRLWLLPADSPDNPAGLKNLGPEPLDRSFTGAIFAKKLHYRRTKIKPLLLDQSFIAGLGNIYADEALHRAGINPEQPANSLTHRGTTRLYRAVRCVLREGIQNRGTSVRDYIDGEGRAGKYQEMLRVYNREGQPCLKCGHPIARKKIGSRSAYYCPACQQQKS